MFRGSFTALVTPFRQDGSLDEKAFADLIEWQIGEGTQGLVPVGTTGESPTLSHAEHRRVVEICVETAKGRAPVIAGAKIGSADRAVVTVADRRHDKHRNSTHDDGQCNRSSRPTGVGHGDTGHEARPPRRETSLGPADADIRLAPPA